MASWYYPCGNFFSKKLRKNGVFSEPISIRFLVLGEGDLEIVEKFRRKIRIDRLKNEKFLECFERRESDFVKFLTHLCSEKLKVFVKYGLPQKGDLIQVPGTSPSNRRSDEGEVRALEGLEIYTHLSTSQFKKLLKKRQKRAQKKNGQNRVEKIFGIQEHSKANLKCEGFGFDRGGVMQVEIDLCDEESPSITSQPGFMGREDRSVQKGSSLMPIEALLEQNSKSSVKNSQERKSLKNHPEKNRQPECSSVYEILASTAEINESIARGDLPDLKTINNFDSMTRQQAQELISRISSKIAVLEKFRSASLEQEQKVVELASSAQKSLQSLSNR